MEFGGEYLLNAPRLAVWDALNNTEMLKAAIPGCQRIDWVSDHELEAIVGVNLGVAKPKFTGDLTLSNIEPAVSYTLSGQGRGGLLGLAHGEADITLDDHVNGTRLQFTASGGASGQIMKLGKAIIGGSAQRVIDGFFERFATAMDVEIEALHNR